MKRHSKELRPRSPSYAGNEDRQDEKETKNGEAEPCCCGVTEKEAELTQDEYLEKLEVFGYVIMVASWLLFVVSVGTIFDLWQWCFRLSTFRLERIRSFPLVGEIMKCIEEQNMVIDNYYLLIFFLNFVILWIWAVASWISMKLFRHSKGGGS